MTPQTFIATWRQIALTERAAAQSHFNDLCALLGEAPPTQADPAGTWFTFEKGAKKTGGGDGWADVWRRHCFAWEYKGKRKNLDEAFKQLQQYAPALDNPPLLIVSDMDVIRIHTSFTNTVQQVYVITLDDLLDPAKRQLLKWAFTDPERLRPDRTRQAVTREAAETFASLAQGLRTRGHAPQAVAHFINKLLFCLFAEDAGLLPEALFTKLLHTALQHPAHFPDLARQLFTAMCAGGFFGVEPIRAFNGGLFADVDVLPLTVDELRLVEQAARLDWAAIEPAIFGTLFERGLDPDKRSQLGAHYTDPDSIRRLLNPVIREPLLAEWAQVKATIAARLVKPTPKTRQQAEQLLHSFLERLRTFRVLDPACGSGNFLYLALQTLKDIEQQVMLEAEALGLQRGFPSVGPEAVRGIEINPYAAELARVTVWIGELQWRREHGYDADTPVLKPLEHIACQDALLNPDGSEAEWPEVNVIVGNPPFLGGSKLLQTLGETYTATLRATYQGRVPGGADLVTYWFEKARAQIETDAAQRAGLVATNSIRGGANRKVLERIIKTGAIFNAWSDEPWINEGAAVRVSLVCFGNPPNPPLQKGGGEARGILNGQPVARINADLTERVLNAEGGDLTQAQPLLENANMMFMGASKKAPFDIPGELARKWLLLPENPNGKINGGVLRPLWNAIDVTRRPRDVWIIDFGTDMTEQEAAFYEAPFEYVLKNVKPVSEQNRDTVVARNWWRHARPRIEMRQAISTIERFIATPAVAKHRVFVWLNSSILPDQALLAMACDDDVTFGILHSRFHELWALRLGTSLEDRPRYTPTTTFETFPFPAGLQPNRPSTLTPTPLPRGEGLNPHAAAIAAAARQLNELRDRWLNPPEWVKRVPEVAPGYPDRLIPKPEHADELKKRTLTNLYNQRPAWLVNVHRALDEAVAAAYGWPADLNDDAILQRLLALNLERSSSDRVILPESGDFA